MKLKTLSRLVPLTLGAVTAAVAFNEWRFTRRCKHDVIEMFEESRSVKPAVITEADIAPLPEPVRRWLRHSNVIGKQQASAVRLRQRGFIRMKKDAAWLPLEAEQYYTTDPPAFVWRARVKAAPMMWFSGVDRYHEGKGHMLIKVLSTFPVVDEQSPEIDQGTLLRYLSEIIWFPSAALSRYIIWSSVDNNSAQATMTYKGVTTSATFYYNEEGEVVDMIAKRYQMATSKSGQAKLETWATPSTAYGEFHNVRIPVQGEAVWKEPTGDFSYIKLEITDVEYNKPALYLH